MRRRAFIGLLGGAAVVLRSKVTLAEATGRMPRVTVLLVGSADDNESGGLVSAFEQGMREAGRAKDVNVHLDYRWGGTDPQHAASAAMHRRHDRCMVDDPHRHGNDAGQWFENGID
jgi:hypothetical protein